VSQRPAETTQVHTRLLKCALEVEDARAFWQHADPDQPTEASQAFDEYWFGARSLPRVRVLLTNFRARFSAFPLSLEVLRGWTEMDTDVRQLICHWHLQLSDPLYRAFTGDYLLQRRLALQPQVSRDQVVDWVGQQGPGRWTAATRTQFASKLLSCAHDAGLVESRRDPRGLRYPQVSDESLTYLLYLLRGIDYEGSTTDNPYLRSVGLDGAFLASRLRGLGALRYQRQGDLVDIQWRYPDLLAWAQAELAGFEDRQAGGSR
jgi:hypothetical protein